MLNKDEVINYFKELKEKAAKIKDPNKKLSVVKDGLNRYTLAEWCEVGDILRNANLI